MVYNNSLDINKIYASIKNLVNSHKAVLIGLNKNKGLANALNIGINKAIHASFILTLDQELCFA